MVIGEQQVYDNLKGTRKTTQMHNVYMIYPRRSSTNGLPAFIDAAGNEERENDGPKELRFGLFDSAASVISKQKTGGFITWQPPYAGGPYSFMGLLSIFHLL